MRKVTFKTFSTIARITRQMTFEIIFFLVVNSHLIKSSRLSSLKWYRSWTCPYATSILLVKFFACNTMGGAIQYSVRFSNEIESVFNLNLIFLIDAVVSTTTCNHLNRNFAIKLIKTTVNYMTSKNLWRKRK